MTHKYPTTIRVTDEDIEAARILNDLDERHGITDKAAAQAAEALSRTIADVTTARPGRIIRDIDLRVPYRTPVGPATIRIARTNTRVPYADTVRRHAQASSVYRLAESLGVHRERAVDDVLTDLTTGATATARAIDAALGENLTAIRDHLHRWRAALGGDVDRVAPSVASVDVDVTGTNVTVRTTYRLTEKDARRG